jgi:hypothetical protein
MNTIIKSISTIIITIFITAASCYVYTVSGKVSSRGQAHQVLSNMGTVVSSANDMNYHSDGISLTQTELQSLALLSEHYDYTHITVKNKR